MKRLYGISLGKKMLNPFEWRTKIFPLKLLPSILRGVPEIVVPLPNEPTELNDELYFLTSGALVERISRT